jgi:segregation and condensation protein B
MDLKAVLEGLLFVVGDEGLSLEQIKDILEIEENQAIDLIKELENEYNNHNRGLKIKYLGNNYKLTTKEEHKSYYEKLTDTKETGNLSQSALEILAIIVYNEPITRVEVDSIRGVSSSQMIRKLVAKGFLKEVGRSDMPGRPILYKTTDEFLDYFGLASRDDLPKLDDAPEEEIIEETNLFLSRYQEDK